MLDYATAIAENYISTKANRCLISDIKEILCCRDNNFMPSQRHKSGAQEFWSSIPSAAYPLLVAGAFSLETLADRIW